MSEPEQRKIQKMVTYRNKNWHRIKHDDCTRVAACVTEKNPDPKIWVLDLTFDLSKFDKLYTQGGVTYYGRL